MRPPDTGGAMSGLPFTKYHWNRLDKGSTVLVTLDEAANVRLMDSSNFTSYKKGRAHKYLGGLSEDVPFSYHRPSQRRLVPGCRPDGPEGDQCEIVGRYRTSRSLSPSRRHLSRSAALGTSVHLFSLTTTVRLGTSSSRTQAKTKHRSLSRSRSPWESEV